MKHRNESFSRDGLEELDNFIASNPKPRELKRALAIKMLAQGLKTETIQKALGVSAPFISKWKVQYAWNGMGALKVKYQGSKGYLSQGERAEIIQWLQSQTQVHLSNLQNYIQDHYGVKFQSKQSYYDLLKEAGMSWKKTQKKIPNEMTNWWSNDIKKSAIY